MPGLIESFQSENKRNLTNYFFQWLIEPDDPPPFRIVLYSTELFFEFLCVPANLIIAWCIYKTQTFHRNVRLIMLNDIICGIVEMLARFTIVINILSHETVISTGVKEIIQFYRGLFIYQVQFSFLSVMLERSIAVNFPERYEKAPISIGITIIVVWWVFIAFMLYVVSSVVASTLGFLVHVSALFLTRYLINVQRSYPKSEATLSTRYQVAENLKTLLMFRYWVYFYVLMSVIEKSFLLSAYICFRLSNKPLWRFFCNFYDLSHAFYVVCFPAFLFYGNSNLRRHLAMLFGKRSRVVRASERRIQFETNQLVNNDDFNSHFQRLERSWESQCPTPS